LESGVDLEKIKINTRFSEPMLHQCTQRHSGFHIESGVDLEKLKSTPDSWSRCCSIWRNDIPDSIRNRG